MEILEITKLDATLILELLEVWENSVKATHLFLSNKEIATIKKYVPQALNDVAHLIIVKNENNKLVAFMGIEENTLEMLFIAPEQRGKGLGKALIAYGIEKYDISNVCVNEQNPQAKGFYEHMGFRVHKRTEYDEQGNPYPLLYLKRDKGSYSK